MVERLWMTEPVEGFPRLSGEGPFDGGLCREGVPSSDDSLNYGVSRDAES